MFDVGFSEMMVIAVVALIVLGPEKLPRVARTVGALLGRMQRYVNDVKADINREIELDELKKMHTTVKEAAQGVENSVRETMSSFESQAKELNDAVTGTGSAAETAPAVPAPMSDAELAAAIHEAQAQALMQPLAETPYVDPAQGNLLLETPAEASFEASAEAPVAPPAAEVHAAGHAVEHAPAAEPPAPPAKPGA